MSDAKTPSTPVSALNPEQVKNNFSRQFYLFCLLIYLSKQMVTSGDTRLFDLFVNALLGAVAPAVLATLLSSAEAHACPFPLSLSRV